MRKALQPGYLAGLRYALFGLGDSGYPEFNVRAMLGYCLGP
jgi:flavodoxin